MQDFDEDALAEAYNRGLELEKAGDRDAAAEAYRQALAIDPADHCGAAVRLAAMGRAEAPARMPDAYVATLFDQHADVFDEILVDRLGYCVPLMARELLRAHASGRFARVLDLGCGTGLTGEALRDVADHITGVDLSERIVELAYDRGVYEDLYVGEAVEFLEEFEDEDGSVPRYDLIAATDVFPYLGAAERIVAGAAARLVSGGLFAFSTETLPEAVLAGRPYMVGARHRFAHALDYLRGLLAAQGFTVLAADPITVRLEEGEPVPGHLVLARLG
ncbi:methyltransferase domain-containing protein [Polymorphum gilvum]|uniref:Methyltransferase domain family n=1 Tax=Polymorphum gilvum (strain LMG 25793 / CGMCC 1.9160 / SL003B-26A1) TaxID=991905 RepID=F2IYC9_POLGS|nr:methyltransferase domain-containing protein [Polymorphum gilvum]ADZ71741.1 Methyltransferase domain family [Polymorphum gilvum SL003B-26A1]